jgi:hypothetical protein
VESRVHRVQVPANESSCDDGSRAGSRTNAAYRGAKWSLRDSTQIRGRKYKYGGVIDESR